MYSLKIDNQKLIKLIKQEENNVTRSNSKYINKQNENPI